MQANYELRDNFSQVKLLKGSAHGSDLTYFDPQLMAWIVAHFGVTVYSCHMDTYSVNMCVLTRYLLRCAARGEIFEFPEDSTKLILDVTEILPPTNIIQHISS